MYEYMDNLYRENILDHFKNPRNFGKIKNYSHSYQGENQFCGDRINVYLKVDTNRKSVADISFTGEGCAIAIASASMLFEKIKKSKLSAIEKIDQEDIQKMLGVKLTISRLKCALLPIEVLHKALLSAKIKE